MNCIFKKLLPYFSQEALILLIESPSIEDYNVGELGAIIRYKFLKPKSKLYRSYSTAGVTDNVAMSRDVLLQFRTYAARLFAEQMPPDALNHRTAAHPLV